MHKSILILDDDEIFADTLARSFSRRGYKATAYYSLTSASNGFTTHPDYAVIDLKIGLDSGLTALNQLLSTSPNTKALILTGYSSIPTTVDAIKRGAVNYLCKPANTDEILLALEGTPAEEIPSITDQPLSVERLEWEHINRILNENQGNISATARALNMHRRTLQRKLAKRPVTR